MLKKVLSIWISFWKTVGTINTYIILSIVFFFLITPIGVIRRVITKNPIKTGASDSYWIKQEENEEMERMF